MRSRRHVTVWITDFGHPEPIVGLPEQLVGNRLAVERDFVDLGDLSKVRVVAIRDIPEPENAVSATRELGRDDLIGPHQTIAVHGEVGAHVGEDDRIGGGTTTGGHAVEHNRPQQPQSQEQQQNQSRDYPLDCPHATSPEDLKRQRSARARVSTPRVSAPRVSAPRFSAPRVSADVQGVDLYPDRFMVVPGTSDRGRLP